MFNCPESMCKVEDTTSKYFYPHLFQLADPEMPPLNRKSFNVSSLPLDPQHLVSTRISEPFMVANRRAATSEVLCRVVALGIETVSEPRQYKSYKYIEFGVVRVKSHSLMQKLLLTVTLVTLAQNKAVLLE